MNSNIGTVNVSKLVSTSARGLYAVILAGGIGSRFWPLSRKSQPKQFLRFLQRLTPLEIPNIHRKTKFLTGLTLIQNTVHRILSLIPRRNIFVVGNKKHSFEIEKQISRFKIPSKNILLEPKGKNTAPAIGLAAARILSRDPDAIMIILPSDHLISKEIQFLSTLKRAKEIATNGYLVTLGIPPKSPETGYGYIKVRNQKPETRNQKIDAYKVERFIEKPSKDRAKRFVKDRNYYWNSGIFIFKAKVILEEIRKYLPDLYKKLNEITCLPDRQEKSRRKLEKIWREIQSISIDYGVMEKTKRAVMIPAKFGWRDLGSWQALDELLPKDKLGNTLKANSLDLGSKNITVFGDKRLIATVGLSDIIIVDTSDALLVCRKDQAQDVKRIVEELTKKGQKDNL